MAERSVHEYELQPGEQQVIMPYKSQPLSVTVKDGKPVLSMLVNPRIGYVQRRVVCVPIGEHFDAGDGAEHVGRFELEGAGHHVFIWPEA